MPEGSDVESIVARPPPSATRRRVSERHLVIAGVLVLWIGGGSVYAAMATSAETIPPLLGTGVRFVIAGSILAAWGRRQLPPGSRRPARAHWRSATVLGTLNVLIGTGGIVVAVKYLPSGTVALLAATAPMWVALVERMWLRRSVSRRVAIGLVIGFAGAGLLVTQSGSGHLDVRWALVVIGCSAAWGLGMVLASVAPPAASVSLVTGMQMVIGGVLMFVLAAAVGELGSFHVGEITERSLVGWIWILLMGALIGFSVCMWLLRVTTPALVATASYVNPVVATVIGWAVLDETISGRTVVSGGLVLVGVVLIVTMPGAGRRQPQDPLH
jgi:drug/metabolite transporter (DMT)-like permease